VRRPLNRGALAVLLSAVWLAACGASALPDDAAIVTDFHNHQSNVEVTADATVIRLLPDRTSSTGTHEQFIIKLSSGDLTIEVEHNISIAARAPVKDGDHVIVHGVYVRNCLLYTSPSPRDLSTSRMPSSA